MNIAGAASRARRHPPLNEEKKGDAAVHRHRALVRAARCTALTLLLATPTLGGEQDSTGDRFVREGVAVEFSARAVGSPRPLREGDYAELAFRITDAGTGAPVRGLAPGAWMDVGQPIAARESAPPLDCRKKMSLYLSGRVGIRPLIDLNSYFILTLNHDSSISVVDPYVGMAGKTYLYAHVPLPRPGADWAKTADDKRVFVTIPRTGELVVVDAESFKVSGKVAVGGRPTRIVAQRDGRYLWVGDDAVEPAGGVVVVDPSALTIAGRIQTGRGHHEIALSADDRWAFVTNRDDGTVSVIDVRRLAKVKDVTTGPQPISVAYSRLSQALYVADGRSGEVSVIDGQHHHVAARIALKPGLGPLRFSDDGRWSFVVNSHENAVHVLDIASNRLAHTVAVGGGPYHLTVTRGFVYVRALDSAKVSMIPLSELDREPTPQVMEFAAGTDKPGSAGAGIAVAAPIVPAVGEAAVIVANPADGNLYFYMEGMMAPMATFRNYGHRPAALEVVNRSLKETAPGVYATTVRLPVAGQYDVGFMLTSPRVVHCFAAEVAANPLLARKGPPLEIQYLVGDHRVAVGRDVTLTFKLTDAATRRPRAGLDDVRVVYHVAPSRQRTQATVREVGDGVYETTVSIAEAGAYYVYVAVPSAKVEVGDLAFLSLIASADARPVGRPGTR
jgi:YVTN family beta-propeller protein